MNIRKTTLAALVGAMPLFAVAASPVPLGPPAPASPASPSQNGAPGKPLMNGPVVHSPQALAAVIGELAAQRAVQGLGAEHNFAVASEHPGTAGTSVVRVNHT